MVHTPPRAGAGGVLDFVGFPTRTEGPRSNAYKGKCARAGDQTQSNQPPLDDDDRRVPGHVGGLSLFNEDGLYLMLNCGSMGQ